MNEHDFLALGVKEPVRISIGIANAQNAASAELRHAHADMAMYLAKRPGNQKVSVSIPGMVVETGAVLSSAETAAVYAAINRTELLEMHYQKIISLPSGGTEYFEALVRIRNADKLIFPGGIFPDSYFSIMPNHPVGVRFEKQLRPLGIINIVVKN